MNWFRKLMSGRYGSDKLNLALLVLSVIIVFVGSIFDSSVVVFIAYAPLILALLRMFSKNIYVRYAENQKFLRFFAPIQAHTDKVVKLLIGTKTHRYYNCPSCKQMVRVPKGRGSIEISCPKCQNKFNKKT